MAQSHWYSWQSKDAHTEVAPAYLSPELGSESAKYEVDASTPVQQGVTHEMAGEGVQLKS